MLVYAKGAAGHVMTPTGTSYALAHVIIHLMQSELPIYIVTTATLDKYLLKAVCHLSSPQHGSSVVFLMTAVIPLLHFYN